MVYMYNLEFVNFKNFKFLFFIIVANKGANMGNATKNFNTREASPSIFKVLQDLTNSLPSSKEIQPSSIRKENIPPMMVDQLKLQNSSIGETITPTCMSIGDDELSNVMCEVYFEKLTIICLEVQISAFII